MEPSIIIHLRERCHGTCDAAIEYIEECEKQIQTQVSELATLRSELETAKLTLFQTEKRLDDKLRTALAELEAARRKLESRNDYIRQLDRVIDDERVADSCINPLEDLQRAIRKLKLDRDTALAAKDAAEKAVKVRDDLLTSAMGVIAAHGPNELWEAIRDLPALTPAPTQEPPAGGVTISNDSGGGYNSATESVLSPDASACDTASKKSDGPIDRALGHYETYSAVTSSNSPADVPSEGRGEWMPIETAPKDGTRILIWNQAMHGTPTAEVAYYSEPLPVDMKRWWKNRNKLFLDVTHWQPLPPPPMLPTEGSGA